MQKTKKPYKGYVVRWTIVSGSRDFSCRLSLSDALALYSRAQQQRSLVSVSILKNGAELRRYTHIEGDKDMGLLSKLQEEAPGLTPFTDKTAMHKSGATFLIVAIRKQTSASFGTEQWMLDIKLSSLQCERYDMFTDVLTPKGALDQTLSLTCSPYRDAIYGNMPKETLPYGPVRLTKTGKAFDLEDIEEIPDRTPPPTNTNGAKGKKEGKQ